MAIAVLVLSALARTGQLRSNKLGLATGLIFAFSSLGHLGHVMASMAPALAATSRAAGRVTALLFQGSLGPLAPTSGAGIAGRYGWLLAAVDAITAIIATYYLTLRRHYRKLHGPGGPQLFEDLRDREAASQLEAEREEALAAYAQKSEFLASMSHEIRTPLNGVLGMAELLRNSDLDERQQRFTKTLIDSGNHLMTIVDEVLDLARIESGRLELHVEDFDLRETVSHVRQLYEPRAATQQTTLQVSVDDAAPRMVRGDSARLRQILSNLVSNAVKFTEQGSVTVQVEQAAADDGRVVLRVTVSDTGIGIAESVLPSLFQPFVQADTSISATYGGTGLGLAICRELVELMDGEIAVDSTPGEGTTFVFTVALEPAAAPTSDAPDADVAVDPTPRHPTAVGATAQSPARADRRQAATAADRGRLLVVEDNQINQEITVETLRWLGFDADVAGDGSHALAALETGTYDAVLMDCRMPTMDGYETTRRIRNRTDTVARIPIIAMTALVDNSDRNKCLNAGMDDFVVKPASLEVLADVLRSHGLTPATTPSAELVAEPAAH